MLNILLILLGSGLTIITIMIFTLFMIAGGLRRSAANVKVLIVSGTIGLAMVALGLLANMFGNIVFITLIPILFWGLAILCTRTFEGVKVRQYIRKEQAKPLLQFLIRIGILSGAISLFDAIGLWIFLLSQGLWNLPSFKELLTILLLLEGALMGAAGGFMFFGLQRIQSRWTSSNQSSHCP